jgi:hypothetical protein
MFKGRVPGPFLLEAAADDVFIAGCGMEIDEKTGEVFDRRCIECKHLWSSGRKRRELE